MSTRSKAKRSTQRKPAKPTAQAKTPAPLQKVEQAQKRLEKAGDIFRQAQDERRTAVQRAWRSGTSAQELSNLLGVSRQKVYDLIGGVKRSKPANAPLRAS